MADTYIEVTSTWKDLTTEASLTTGTDYLIQNLGVFPIQSYVGASDPVETTKAGTKLLPDMQAHYKPASGESLWVRSPYGDSSLNISEAASE